MDVFEAHKYLDPTTLDDSSFLSFSSFADLTRTPYDESLSPIASSSSARSHLKRKQPQLVQPQRLQSQAFGLYQSFDLESYSTPTPPSSHSDSGSEASSTPRPFHAVACSASSSYTPRTPTSVVHDLSILHTPSSSPLINRGGPSRYSAPTTTPSHHVSHRSASSSSDWNSPVTPSLTYKSSVDSLASFAPEPDFFLPPPSTNTAFGWDDQSLGSSSSLTLRSPNSPPSPSPHRIASNPTLGKNRHPRTLTQVKSLPSLREEGAVSMDNNEFANSLFDQFTNFENLALGSDNQDWSAKADQQTLDPFFDSIDFASLVDQANQWASEAQSTSAGSTSAVTTSCSGELASLDSFTLSESFNLNGSGMMSMLNAPSLVPDMSSASTDTNVADVQYTGWQPETSLSDQDLYGSSQPGSGDNDFTQYLNMQDDQRVQRPVTAPQQPSSSRPASSSFSLAAPARGMARRCVTSLICFATVLTFMLTFFSVSSNAANPIKSTDMTYSYTSQQHVLSDPLVQYASFSDQFSDIDPALMGMSSTKPADLTSPPIIDARRVSHTYGINVEGITHYAMYQQQGQYGMAPSSAPYALQSQPDIGSVQPMSLQPGSAAYAMNRVGSQPLPGARGQFGVQPINTYQRSRNTSSQYSEAERQHNQPRVAPRKVSMEEASVMQPWVPIPIPEVLVAYPSNGQQRGPQQYQQPQQQQQQFQMQQQQQQPMPTQIEEPQYLGWESPNTVTPATRYAPPIQRNLSMGSGPVMTNAYAPLNIHPPANSFHPNPNPSSRMQSAPAPHRVHPPPHPGSIASGSGSGYTQQQRPMAPLPTGKTPGRQSRKVTAGPSKPKTPKTPGRKKNMPEAGIQEHEGTFFANFTPEDGQTLLKGVAPSGSQSKRKREANASLIPVPMAQTSSGSDISGDEDSRSKRSRSNASSSNDQ